MDGSPFDGAVPAFVGGHQREIDVAIFQLFLKLDAGGQHDADFDFRMGCGKARENVGQETCAEIIGCAETHPTFHRRHQKARYRLLIDPQHLARIAEQRLAIRCQRHRAAFAREQRPAELLLQTLHLHADRRRCAQHSGRRRCETSGVGDGDERPHQIDVEKHVGGRLHRDLLINFIEHSYKNNSFD